MSIRRRLRVGFVFCALLAVSAAFSAEPKHPGGDSSPSDFIFVGSWPFCGAHSVACDDARQLVYVGSGGGVYILDVSDPRHPKKVSDIRCTGGGVGSLIYEPDSLRLYVGGVEIWDVSDIQRPFMLGSCCAKSGPASDAAIQDSFAYVASGNYLKVINISDPSSPAEVGSFNVETPARGVAVSDSLAFVGGNLFDIVNVAVPSNPWLASKRGVNGPAFDVAAIDSFALVASFCGGLRVFNVSVPSHPEEVGRSETLGGLVSIIVSYPFAYTGCENLGVFDISDPPNPALVGVCGEFSGDLSELALAGSCIYASNGGEGLQVIDISDPSNPERIGGFEMPDEVHDVYVSGPHAYLTDGYDGLYVIDISDKSRPVEVGHCDLPNRAEYIHVSGSYAYVTLATRGISIVDVSRSSEPHIVGSIGTWTWAYARGIWSSGSYVYVADSWQGVHIVDASDPSNPVEVGCYEPGVSTDGVAVRDKIAYVACYSGLHVVDVSTPSMPLLLGSCSTRGSARDVSVVGSYAYVAAEDSGLSVIDVSDPVCPHEVGHYSRDWPWVLRVYASGSYAYVIDDNHGFYAVDVRDPSDPRFDAYCCGAEEVFASDPYVYVARGSGGFYIYSHAGPTGTEESTRAADTGLKWVVSNPVLGDHVDLQLSVERPHSITFVFYDVSGRKVGSLPLGQVSSGEHEFEVPAGNLASGVYFLRLEAETTKDTKKLVLLR